MTVSVPFVNNSKDELSVSDWQASVPFGEGLKRSTFLLRQQFFGLVRLFFVGGLAAALIILPIDIMSAYFEALLTESLTDPMDITLVAVSFAYIIAFNFLREFTISFAVFLLGTLAIHRIIQNVPKLKNLNQRKESTKILTPTVLKAGVIVALILASASLIAFPYPFMYILLFFTPALVVLTNQNASSAVRQSMQMRHNSWRRIFGALLFCGTLNIFAGTLGVMVYFNIETVISLLGGSLGWVAPFLLAVVTQLPVAMVAPIFSILSLVFYSGALAALEDNQHRKYLRRQHLLERRRMHLVPFGEQLSTGLKICKKCGKTLKPNTVFCVFCGERVEETSIAPSSN
ncbi:MAG: zinc ribbon domain-containing protein [Promethearchaeota archaeon]